MRRTYAFLLLVGVWNLPQPVSAVDFAAIQMGPVTGSTKVTIPAGQGTLSDEALETEGFFIDPGAALGEFPIRIGDDWTDDAANGVLLTYVHEIGRAVGAETVYATASTVIDTRGGAGGLSVAVRRAGADTPGSPFNGNAPFNANVVAAYFPFNQGWLGGTALTSDDATFDHFIGSPELDLGNVKPNFWGEGPHLVTLPGVQDTRRQGFVFATASNSKDLALVSPTSDGSGIAVSTIVSSKHGGPDTPGSFQFSPFSFLFIPRGTTNITMGRIHPSDGPDLEPFALISSGSDFTISREDVGLFRLSIVGGSPRQGALLVSPHGANDGAGGRSDDNIIQYEPDGDDWLIISQDLPNLNGIGQDATGSLTYFDFAYLPFESPPMAPGPVPPLADLTNFSSNRMFAYSAQVIQNNDSNGPGSVHQVLTGGPSDLAIHPSGSRGDLTFAVDGGFVSVEEGVLIPTVTEGYRDNGRVVGYGLIAAGEADGELQVFTAAATPTYRYSEHNVNYAAAFFGADSGFDIGNNVPLEDGFLELAIDGVSNTGDEGVLIVAPFGKEDRFATAGPRADGSGWDIELRNSDTELADGDINYVYLPFETEDLVAGRIDMSGNTLASTGEEGFTLTKEDIGTYRLSIPDKSAETGMLLLTGLGSTVGIENEDNYLVYQPDGNDFLIIGLDMVSVGQATGGEAVEPEDTAFAFAYIDFDPGSVVPPLVGIDSLCLAIQAGGNSPVFDVNGDGVVDDADLTAFLESAQRLPGDANFDGEVQFGDFVTLAENFGKLDEVWSNGDFTCDSQVQFGDFVVLANNFGKSPSAGQVQAAAVPEPSSVVLLFGCAALFSQALRRRTD